MAGDLTPLLDVALSAARAAGTLLSDGFRKEVVPELKGEVDLVTEYDRRAETLVVSILRQALPDHSIEGEEFGKQSTSAAADGPVWYVDPLDGTTNFAHHLPWFAVSLGLVIDGRSALGVILAPELGWTFTALRGQGAKLDGKPIHVSRRDSLKRALLATGFPYDRSGVDITAVGRAVQAARGLRRFGSAALDCAAVACGWLDAYWQYGLAPWDVAAGTLLVEEAGGVITNPAGGQFSLNEGNLLASNGLVHDALIGLLR